MNADTDTAAAEQRRATVERVWREEFGQGEPPWVQEWIAADAGQSYASAAEGAP